MMIPVQSEGHYTKEKIRCMIILYYSTIEDFVCNRINIQISHRQYNLMPSMFILGIIPFSYLDLLQTQIQIMLLIPIILAIIIALLAIRYRGRKSKERLKRLTLERLKSMDPKEFEYAVADMLRAMDYKDVRVVGGSGDLAVDITAKRGKDKVVIQCKRYTGKKVTSPELQMFIGMMLTEYKATKGIYVTTSSFTQDAVELARRHGIELWDGDRLAEVISRLS